MTGRVSMMACCLRSKDQGGQNPSILDVEEIVQDYVWDFFKATRPPWQQLCLRRKDFDIEVPMNYFHFDKLREEVRPRHRPLDPQPQHHAHPSLVAGMTHLPRDVTRNALMSNANVMALSTDFTNRTDKDQTYKFRFEKTRKASLSVTFQRGYTIGGKVNFSLGLPKLASSQAGGEVDMHLTVSRATGETIEETLTWEATSEINVSKTSSFTARVLLSEAPVSYNFKLWTKMTMPSGAAPVTIRKRSNSRSSPDRAANYRGLGSFRYTHVVSNLQMVFEKYKDVVDMLREPTGNGDNFNYSVVFKTTGIVEGVRLSDQKILLEGQELGASRRSSYPTAGGGGGGGYGIYGGRGGGGDCGDGGAYGVIRRVPQHHQPAGGAEFSEDLPPPLPPQALSLQDLPSSTDSYPGDGYAVIPAATHAPSLQSSSMARGGGRLYSPSPLSPHSPPIPIIEEMPEDEGGAGESDGGIGRGGNAHQTPPATHAQASRGTGNCPAIGPLPRITTTPSSQASSPLSESGGSGDMSEASKKSETITTV